MACAGKLHPDALTGPENFKHRKYRPLMPCGAQCHHRHGVASMAQITASQPLTDKRKYERIKLFLPGHLFNPLNEQSTDCKVLNLSAGGAAVQCDAKFPAGLTLVLYIENFGRFEGTTIIHASGQLALEFAIGEGKRGRLKDMIKSFAADGVAGVAQMRKHSRMPALISGSITRANGEHISCDVLDISLDGVSLRTS